MVQKEDKEIKLVKNGSDALKEKIVDGDRKDERKELKAVKSQKPDLKKSKSYGAPSTTEYIPSKQKVKHSFSVVPSASQNSKGTSWI